MRGKQPIARLRPDERDLQAEVSAGERAVAACRWRRLETSRKMINMSTQPTGARRFRPAPWSTPPCIHFGREAPPHQGIGPRCFALPGVFSLVSRGPMRERRT
jgi:hypothetical protein